MGINILNKAKLFKQASIYTGSNILSALVPFMCMPVLTRYLTPEDYGVVAIMGSMISFLTPFVGMNIHGAIAASYYHDDVDFIRFVRNCLGILVLSTVAVSIIVFVFSAPIARYTLFPADWLWAIVIVCFGQFLLNIQLTILQVSQKAKNYGIVQVLNVICNTALSIGLIVIFSMNWEGRAWAQVITSATFLVWSVVFFRNYGIKGLSFDKDYIKKALSFGVPLIPHAISGYLLTMADRFYIANFVDVATAGLFVLGAQIGQGISLLTDSFNKAYVPWLFEKLQNITESTKIKLVRYTYIYFVGILIIAGAYSFVMPYFLGFFVGEKFYSAGNYVWAFAFAGALNGMYYMVVNYIFYVGNTTALMYRTFGGSIFHIAVSFFLTKSFGAEGASYAVLLSYFIIFAIVWQLSSKIYNMPWFGGFK